MLVIRIEHPIDGWGSFRSHDGKYFDGLYRMYDRHGSLPVPSLDGIYMSKDMKEWFCAYKTLEQLKEWVTIEEIEILIDYGFNIHMLEVEEYQVGYYQIVYTKESIISNNIINDLFKIKPPQ